MSSETDVKAELQIKEGDEYVPPIVTHLIRSTYVAQTFKIQVMRPPLKYGEETTFPTLYATDGNLTFGIFSGIAHLLHSSVHAVQRFILVGIGYAGDSPRAGAYLRGRDFIFPGYPELSRAPPTQHGVLPADQGGKHSFGAEDFQRFIEHELIPLIDNQYATIPGERSYFGHSAGGGFGLFTLFTKSELFRNYIISSPGLTYHGRSPGGVHYENYDFMLERARQFAAAKRTLGGIRLCLSVGGKEEFEPELACWRLTSSFYQMVAFLKSAEIPGLELITELLLGETHATAWPIAYMHGVRAVLRITK
jgi:uncharacterized protein